jgi:hypothetical protein
MKTRKLSTLILLLLVAGIATAQFPPTPICDIQWVEAGDDTSGMYDDSVSVTGIVTVESGLFYAGAHITFYMQEVTDECGPEWAGMLIYNYQGEAFDVLRGDLVRVRGQVSEYATPSGNPLSNMTEVVTLADVEILDEGQPIPDPIVIFPVELDSSTHTDYMAEIYEGCLVTVEDVYVSDNSSPYSQFSVSDQGDEGECIIRVYSDSLYNFNRPPVGAMFESITGVVYHVYANYTLMPRTMDDLVLAVGPPVISGTDYLPCGPGTDDEVLIETHMTDDTGIDEAFVWYRINGTGPFYQSLLTQVGDITYTGTIEAQEEGTTVEFYVNAIDDDGEESFDPPDAPDNEDYFSYFVTDASANSIYEVQYTEDASGDSPFVCREATFTGIVTVDTTDYGYAAVDWRKFFIQDVTDPQGTGGPWNGVLVYSRNDDANYIGNLNRGDEVTVTGSVSEYYNMTEVLEITDWEVLSSDNDGPDAVVVDCATAQTEPYESLLVTIDNAEVVDQGEGFNWVVNDGSGDLTVTTGCTYDYIPELGDFLDITGVIQFDYGEFQLMPRDDLDLLLEGVDAEVVPAGIELSDAYPNPFNPSTTINYTIPGALSGVDINLSIYNVTGQLVAELVDGPRGAGLHTVVWNADNGQGQGVASGVYFYRFKVQRGGQTLQLNHQKLLYLK